MGRQPPPPDWASGQIGKGATFGIEVRSADFDRAIRPWRFYGFDSRLARQIGYFI